MIKIPNRNNLLFFKKGDRIEWATKQRAGGIGGSEIATLFGLNDFTTQIELFYNKVKLIPPTPDNLATYSGRIQEDTIAKKYFVFYDPTNPTEERMLANIAAEKEVRHIERFNSAMQMKNHPIVLNVDRLVMDEFDPDGAVVEIKNLLSWVVRQYDAEILPSHIMQLQTYMLGTGFKKAYLVYLLDGRHFKVYPIEANADIQASIIQRATQFWEIVEKGRAIWNDPLMKESDKMLALYELEPPMESNDSLKEFINLRFKEEGKMGKMMVTEEIGGFIGNYKKYRDEEVSAGKQKDLYGNHLRSIFVANGCDECVNPDGKVIVSYRISEKTGNPVLRIS